MTIQQENPIQHKTLTLLLYNCNTFFVREHHPGLAEIIAPIGGLGSDVISQVKWP